MPRNDVRERLRNIIEAIDGIGESLRGQSYERFVANREKVDSVVLNFFKIGENVRQLPDELLESRGAVPWRKIEALRNLIARAHGDPLGHGRTPPAAVEAGG